MNQKFQRNPYGDEHPFDKVFGQIETLLAMMEKNKTKSLSSLPEWIFDELIQIEKEYERFKKVVSQTTPMAQLDEKEFRKLVRKLPEDQRPVEADLVEKARLLKQKAEQIQQDYYSAAETEKEKEEVPKGIPDNSPMALLKKEEESVKPEKDEEQLRASFENKKKYGRIGGRKNWRPM